MFELWIWPDNRNETEEERVRTMLRRRPEISWSEHVEYCFTYPITLVTPFGEYAPCKIESFLEELTISDGTPRLGGLTAEECDHLHLAAFGLN